MEYPVVLSLLQHRFPSQNSTTLATLAHSLLKETPGLTVDDLDTPISLLAFWNTCLIRNELADRTYLWPDDLYQALVDIGRTDIATPWMQLLIDPDRTAFVHRLINQAPRSVDYYARDVLEAIPTGYRYTIKWMQQQLNESNIPLDAPPEMIVQALATETQAVNVLAALAQACARMNEFTLAQHLIDRIPEQKGYHPDWDARSKALATFAAALAKAKDPRAPAVIQATFQAITVINDYEYVDCALRSIALAQANGGGFAMARQTCAAMESLETHLQALCEIAELQFKAQDPNLETTLAVAKNVFRQSTQYESQPGYQWVKFVTTLAAIGHPDTQQACAEAYHIVRKIQATSEHASLIQDIISTLGAVGSINQAMELIETIVSPEDQVKSKLVLARSIAVAHPAEAYRLIEDAQAQIETVSNSRVRSHLLNQRVELLNDLMGNAIDDDHDIDLTQHLMEYAIVAIQAGALSEAHEIIQKIDHDDLYHRVEALRKLIAALIEAGESMKAIRYIQEIWIQCPNRHNYSSMMVLVEAFIERDPDLGTHLAQALVQSQINSQGYIPSIAAMPNP